MPLSEAPNFDSFLKSRNEPSNFQSEANAWHWQPRHVGVRGWFLVVSEMRVSI